MNSEDTFKRTQVIQEYQTMEYKVDDKELDVSVFIDFVNQI